MRPAVLRSLALLATLHLPPTALAAQLVVNRGQLPALRDTSQRARLLAYADLERAPGQARSDASWHYRLGADVGLGHLGRSVEVATILGHELVSTAENALGFDPRGVAWTEQLVVRGFTRSGWRWDADAFMRCRHDVDSGEPADSGAQRARKRVITLPGLAAGLATPERRFGHMRVRAVTSLELYGGATDARAPVNRRPPRWSQAQVGWTSTAQAATGGPGSSEWYLRGWGSLLLFREPEATWYANHRLELGLRIPTAARDLDLFAATERQVDDMLLPAPRSARLTLIGLRLATHALR